MNDKFLKYYFEKELYVENPQMNMDNFIKFCKKRGIGIDKSKLEELEFKEKFYPIFRSTDLYHPYYGEYFGLPLLHPQDRKNAIKYLNDGKIYLPKNKEFKKFKDYIDTETKSLKTYSYYSAFQIYSLVEILNEEKTGKEKVNKINHEDFVNLLIAIQLYSPYGKSNLKIISIRDEKTFYNKLEEFNLDEALKIINIKQDFLYKAYVTVCNELKNLLGSNDIIQLWKHIEWSKKDKCVGHTRLGIEYLQWAMMLKKCIENYCGHEILDVDETNGDWKKVRDTLPQNETGRTLRGVRNKWYTNKLTDEYEFRLNRQKLYYLCNSLSLDYHPRVIVFVEGYTEEIMIPKFFEFCGYNFKNLGFEIINIDGISNFYGSEIKLKDENNKYLRKVISNFKHLINFNFHLWQAIPFFIGDNENNIHELIMEGEIFDINKLIEEFDDRDPKDVINELEKEHGDEINKTLIESWTHIWDYDFELDNFTSEELKNAINEVCKTNVSSKDIDNLKDIDDCKSKKGIKSLIGENCNKIEINKKAFNNMKKNYDDTDSKVFKRPIFEVINKLLNIHRNNYQPINTMHALKNREKINKSILLGKDIFRD